MQRVEQDGYGRPVVRIRVRRTGRIVKCILHDLALEKVQQRQIADVLHGCRIRVIGTIHYKALGRPDHMTATDVRFFRDKNDLPSLQDIEDVTFAGGLRSEDYLELVRDGERS